ncbi:hypothetical protein K505DRAFT_368091 [Melanomma pulvis-pyrius CBS 109.77]|uniref:Uncharacterized protein n=1 Tax=Melanomma pulvis-pyrius CBS 109.77 TaxID=1314802 RepID=A0A6A6WRP5_9PLEO|nr:hypothetical protein K505DRAFT_368091 [Melanomma pulvis-pyrius CBS 109.77]
MSFDEDHPAYIRNDSHLMAYEDRLEHANLFSYINRLKYSPAPTVADSDYEDDIPDLVEEGPSKTLKVESVNKTSLNASARPPGEAEKPTSSSSRRKTLDVGLSKLGTHEIFSERAFRHTKTAFQAECTSQFKRRLGDVELRLEAQEGQLENLHSALGQLRDRLESVEVQQKRKRARIEVEESFVKEGVEQGGKQKRKSCSNPD